MLLRAVGLLGTVLCIALFVRAPSFPTPDKLVIFLAFVFMIFNQAWAMLKRLLPFVIILLFYESFRGLAHQINKNVNYYLAPHFDKFVFRQLPTITLQHWLWKGRTSWYDYVFYLAYMMHFIFPIGLAILVWKTREKFYWRVVSTYLVVAFSSFITFFLLPAAPPWLASQNHYIEPIRRISSDVWAGLGLHNFPSVYNHISPNPVAAIPSLHAAWATLLVIFVYRLYGLRWSIVAGIYPLLIYVGTVYQGEHYAFDVIAGIIYASLGYLLTPYVMRLAVRGWQFISSQLPKPHLTRV